jgi:hypothetical protein
VVILVIMFAEMQHVPILVPTRVLRPVVLVVHLMYVDRIVVIPAPKTAGILVILHVVIHVLILPG